MQLNSFALTWGTLLGLTLGLASPASVHAVEPDHAEDHAILIVKVQPEQMEAFAGQLAEIYRTAGSDAAAQWVHRAARDEKTLPLLQAMAGSPSPIQASLQAVHPDEKSAIEWMNQRLANMGLGAVKFTPEYLAAAEAEKTPSPMKLSEDKVKGVKYLRYTAGAGVALIGALVQCFGGAHGAHSDYVGLIAQTAGAGVMSILLELQFANPKINDNFWTPVWRLGGKIGGRVTNILVNTLYGLSLWGASVGAVALAGAFGYDVSHFAQAMPAFTTALTTSFVGGLIFHAAMGQYQTDLSIETQERGALSPVQRYRNETTGVVLNNGARVSSWIVPGPWSNAVMFGFFLLKTLPQLLKTNFQVTLEDRKTRRLISPETAPQETFLEKCANLLGKTGLVNLPVTQK